MWTLFYRIRMVYCIYEADNKALKWLIDELTLSDICFAYVKYLHFNYIYKW